MKYFNLAKDGVPELLLNKIVDEQKAEEIAIALSNQFADTIRIKINSFG